MDAIVLVGGEGTRMRPLTYELPKQMLPVVDRPMIEHVVAWLVSHGIRRVVLSLGYRPDSFSEAFPTGELAGAHLVYATEPDLLDTAGAVRFAARYADVEETFLVLNGDVLSDFDVTSLVQLHQVSGAKATIQLTPVADPCSFGVVPVDSDGRVTAFIEKPEPDKAPTNLVNAGCYILEPAVLGQIAPDRRVSMERETFPSLVERGELYALASHAYWLDTGTPENYIRASLDVLRGLRTELSLPRVPQLESGVFVHPAASVAGGVLPASYIGPRATISPGAEVANAVVSEGASVAEGARISGSIVMAGARVGRDAVIESSVVGPGAAIGDASSVTRFSVIGARCEVGASSSLEAARFGPA
ncbi:MAG: sugar phosphate nucleotidyltransferase [Acidimicrobiales bacterium]